jgi:hypothetical protein
VLVQTDHALSWRAILASLAFAAVDVAAGFVARKRSTSGLAVASGSITVAIGPAYRDAPAESGEGQPSYLA